MSKLTSLAAFQGLFNRAPAVVEVPNVGTVSIRKLSAGDVSQWQAEIIGTDLKPTRDGLFRADASLTARAIVDDQGAPVFAGTQQVLDELPADVVRALGKAVREANKINAPAEEEAGN